MAAKTGTGQRYKARNEEFALALAAGKTPVEAGAIAGFKGEANAKRNAQRGDIKKRVAELRAPHLEKINEAIGVSVEWATAHCKYVADKALGEDCEPSVGDGLRAVDLAAKLNGWIPQGDDAESKTPTVIKFQLNIFDNVRNISEEKTIEHQPKALTSP